MPPASLETGIYRAPDRYIPGYWQEAERHVMDDMPRADKAPRKPKTSKRRRPALWRRAVYNVMRLGLWSLAALLFVLFFNKVWHPYGLNRKLQKDLAETSAQLESVRQDNARQMRRIEYLQTPQGKAAEARRLGYHFPGEVPLRLQEPPAPKPQPQPATD